jgi:small-conductance mechanosensitive channel
MGRAIAVAFLLVVFSIGFVLLQLWTRRSATPPPSARRQPMFVTRDDGSVYAVSLQLTQFEQRLVEEEERSRKLLQEVDAVRKEREALTKDVAQLQEELRRLRRQVTQPAAPPPSNAPAEPANPDGSTPPESGAPGTTTPPPGG